MPASMVTTQVDVLRQSDDQMAAEPDGTSNAAPRQVVASAVNATLTAPNFTATDGSTGQRVITHWRLYCDPVDLRYTDVVLDRATGQAYSVDAVARRTGLSMDYLVAQVHAAKGLSTR